jgi:prepilin-type N-terminal cleavage/methylation domain-containing protein
MPRPPPEHHLRKQIMKTNSSRVSRAFTLIELLVVIAIIAMLAGIALPAITQAQISARIVRATSDARQIFLALKGYSADHDGAFPGAEAKTSNEAFRELFPTYMQVEANFAVGSSPVGKKADNKIEPHSRALERGENHWAYVAGLSDASNALWPIIVDHTDGSGSYGIHENEPGGTWGGRKAIMVRCDGGGVAPALRGTGAKRFLPRFDDEDQNALELTSYMGDGVRLLEPEH